MEGVDDPNYKNPYYTKEPNPLAPTMAYEEMLNELEQYENGEAIPIKGLISRINRLCDCNLFLYV